MRSTTATQFRGAPAELQLLFGEQLTIRHSGRDMRLTDVHGHVLKDILT